MSDVLGAQEPKKWHVIYIKARHEKAVYEELMKRGVESFLPLKKELHQWSDRKKWVDVPLFSSYVFINIEPAEKDRVYLSEGFVKFVSMNGKPSIVPEWQIEYIRKVVSLYPEALSVFDQDKVGKRGIIVSGPLSGMRGEIIDVMNEHWFMVRIDGLENVLGVKVPASIFQAAG
ncbi:MAG: UpxY family transcription antiterminator [Bacteroidetes bacterium]|nr:UpxY family transcription antiterminator [Bacteroidota bacterium]